MLCFVLIFSNNHFCNYTKTVIRIIYIYIENLHIKISWPSQAQLYDMQSQFSSKERTNWKITGVIAQKGRSQWFAVSPGFLHEILHTEHCASYLTGTIEKVQLNGAEIWRLAKWKKIQKIQKNIEWKLTTLASCFVKYDSTTWFSRPWIKRNAVLSKL